MKVSLRDRKKEQTRLDIQRAAVDLFLERGYDATTVEDIVQRANYSRSTFIRYFGVKEDVLFGDLPQRFGTFIATLQSRPKSYAEAWQTARQAITQTMLHITANAPELQAICVELWHTEPALEARYAKMVLDTERALAEFFARVENVDPARSVRCQTLAAALTGVARSATRAWVSERTSILELLDSGFATLADGQPSD